VVPFTSDALNGPERRRRAACRRTPPLCIEALETFPHKLLTQSHFFQPTGTLDSASPTTPLMPDCAHVNQWGVFVSFEVKNQDAKRKYGREVFESQISLYSLKFQLKLQLMTDFLPVNFNFRKELGNYY